MKEQRTPTQETAQHNNPIRNLSRAQIPWARRCTLDPPKAHTSKKDEENYLSSSVLLSAMLFCN